MAEEKIMNLITEADINEEILSDMINMIKSKKRKREEESKPPVALNVAEYLYPINGIVVKAKDVIKLDFAIQVQMMINNCETIPLPDEITKDDKAMLNLGCWLFDILGHKKFLQQAFDKTHDIRRYLSTERMSIYNIIYKHSRFWGDRTRVYSTFRYCIEKNIFSIFEMLVDSCRAKNIKYFCLKSHKPIFESIAVKIFSRLSDADIVRYIDKMYKTILFDEHELKMISKKYDRYDLIKHMINRHRSHH